MSGASARRCFSLGKGGARRTNLAHADELIAAASRGSRRSPLLCRRVAAAATRARLESDAFAIDTVVFPLRSAATWGSESWTEIVALRSRGKETDHLKAIAGHLRCGRPPNLRRCSPDEPAMIVHGSMCAQHTGTMPFMASLYKQAAGQPCWEE